MADLPDAQQPPSQLDALPTELFENVAKELSDLSDIKALCLTSRECAAKISAVCKSRRFSDFSIDFENKASLIAGLASARRPTIFGAETRNVTITILEKPLALNEEDLDEFYNDFCERSDLLGDIFAILKKSQGIALYLHIISVLPPNRHPDVWSPFDTILSLVNTHTFGLSELIIDVERPGHDRLGALPMNMLFVPSPYQSRFEYTIQGLSSLKLSLSKDSGLEVKLAKTLASMSNLRHLSLLTPLEDEDEVDTVLDPLLTLSLRSLVTLKLDGFILEVADLSYFTQRNKMEDLTFANTILLLGTPDEDDSLRPEETLGDGLTRMIGMPVVIDHNTKIDYKYNYM